METLNIVKEEVPKIARVGGAGREPEKWEEHLTPVRKDAGQSYKISVHKNTEKDVADKKNRGKGSASNRANSMRGRLDEAVPMEKWALDVRPTKGSTEIGKDEKDKPIYDEYGVYATYNGQYTTEEIVKRAAAKEKRSDNVKARIAAAPAESNGSSDKGTDSPSPKERVAAAAKGGK